MSRWLLIFLLLNATTEIAAQYYVSGQEPSWVKWRQHNQEYARFIFTENSDSLAVQFIGYMNSAIELAPLNLNHKPSKFPVVFHSNSILSNGFVSWAPKRVEVVSTPSLDASPEPWLLSLALHETRHVVQIDKLNNGLVKFGYFLFGEQAIGAAAGLVPLWFLEGDAVFAETEYTYGGRGRQASFYRIYRTHLLDKRPSKYSYDKWLLGSYKDYIPNHYNFGYQMVGYVNLKYGYNVWNNALDKVAKQPYTLFPFYFSLKKDIGLSRKGLFLEAFSHLDTLWIAAESKKNYFSCNFLISSATNKNYVEYRFPNFVNDTTIIALKETLTNSAEIVIINTKSGDEKTIHHPGYLTNRISISSDYIFWTQFATHPRWHYLNYSELWRIDLRNRKLLKLSSKTRYFNPIQIDSQSVAVIENTPEGKSFIALLDINGSKQSSFTIPPTLEAKEICSADKLGILVRCSSPNGSVVLQFKSHESTPDTILGPVFWDISNISYNDSLLYFTKTYNYKEELFCFDIAKKEIRNLTDTPFGLSNILSLENGAIMASVFTPTGSLPAILKSEDFKNKVVNNFCINDPLYKMPDNSQKIKTTSGLALGSRKYTLFRNLFHFHSWAPVYYNPTTIMSASEIKIYPGATIITQNLTSTLISNFGYSYNQTHGFHAYSEWLGWYPVLSVGIDVGNEFATIQGGPLALQETTPQTEPRLKASFGLRLPYNISSGYVTSGVNGGFNFHFTNSATWDFEKEEYSKGVSGLEPYLSVYALTRMAHRDIRPKFGLYGYINTLSSPFEKNILGNSYLLNSSIYLPGIASNHSLMLSAQWEKQYPSQYIRTPRISFPRGHISKFYERALSYKVNYSFPFLYPDLPIGPLVYIKRFFANIFFDNAIIDEYSFSNEGVSIVNSELKSAGIEINSDINILRTPYSYQIGYRFGLNINEKLFFNGLIISFDLNNLYGSTPNNVFYELNF